jgi:hydrogenase maturation protein HypF
VITSSRAGHSRTQIAPDAATCPQCLADTLNPTGRFYRYPFTNCTHCGPRLSIIRAIPYDRCHTSMAGFPMCPACQAEYDDPLNRRFHAQPVACDRCGPQVWLETGDGPAAIPNDGSAGDVLDTVCHLLQRGEIVAIKGIGGIHLACDATNESAVSQLRRRKRRYHKPFALMVRDLSVIAPYCSVSEEDGFCWKVRQRRLCFCSEKMSGSWESLEGRKPQALVSYLWEKRWPLHRLLPLNLFAPLLLLSPLTSLPSVSCCPTRLCTT